MTIIIKIAIIAAWIPGVPVVGLAAALLVLVGCGSGEETADSAVLSGGAYRAAWADDAHLDTTPVRAIEGLALQRVGFTYDCMECHRLLKARWHHERPLVEHRDLKLEHGANRFCLNCHHPTNRNAFVDYDGSEIAESNVVALCAKCHGTTHRDWKRGIHGRQTGSGRTPVAERPRLACIACHDPHRPAFPALKPATAPTYPHRAAGARVDAVTGGDEQEH